MLLANTSHWSLSELDGLSVKDLNFWTAQALRLKKELYEAVMAPLTAIKG